ncbi:MAG TPA: tetratricopeptide repeat protein [Candidatus Bathyarchaeia archaeon]|nr:tetratricopeptide repeat protein [Candidatus Bathyarchaeia archaeon]
MNRFLQKTFALAAAACIAAALGVRADLAFPAPGPEKVASVASTPISSPPEQAQAGKPIDTINEAPYRARLAILRAQEKGDKGDFKGAVEELTDFLSKHPGDDHFLVENQLANYLVQANRQEDALAHYRTAVTMERRFSQGWLSLGQVAYNLGRYDAAAEAIKNGYELSATKQPNLLYYAAASYVMAKQPANAAPLLEDLISGSSGTPKLEWLRALIAAYAELKDTERGRKAVASLLKWYGDNPDAWYVGYQFYAGTGDYEQAAVMLTVVGYMRPLTREQTIQLGDIYCAIKAPGLATASYEQAFKETKGTPHDYEKLASAYIASHDLEAAKQAIADGLREQSTYRLWSLLGDIHFIEMNYLRSFEDYYECAKLDSTQGRPHLMMGYSALQLDRPAVAIPHLERAVEFPDQKKIAEQLLKRARALAPASTLAATQSP